MKIFQSYIQYCTLDSEYHQNVICAITQYYNLVTHSQGMRIQEQPPSSYMPHLHPRGFPKLLKKTQQDEQQNTTEAAKPPYPAEHRCYPYTPQHCGTP